jgi:CRP/FNR family cyclic AMP-dependent transcriptional regulator
MRDHRCMTTGARGIRSYIFLFPSEGSAPALPSPVVHRRQLTLGPFASYNAVDAAQPNPACVPSRKRCGGERIGMAPELVNPLILRQVDLFADLPEAALAALAARARLRAYRKGEVLFHKDDPGSALFVLKSGRVKISTFSAEGKEAVFTVHRPGDVFGELALLDGARRSATATALEPSKLVTIDRAAFVAFLRDQPEASLVLLGELAARVRRLTLQVEDLIFLDIPGRLARTLLRLGDQYGRRTDRGLEIDLQITQTELGGMVGATRVSVNRLLHWFASRGLIAMDERRIVILRPEALQARIIG